VFLVLLAGVYLYVDGVLKIKVEDMIHFYQRKRQDIDVFFVGSSTSHCTVNPVTVWKTQGIPSYDLGEGSQTVWQAYYYMKEGLKYQNPKIIVYEIFRTVLDTEYDLWYRSVGNTIMLKLSKEKVDAVQASSPDKRLALLLGFPVYHNRYRDISKNDFIDPHEGGDTYMNGYLLLKDTNPQTRTDSAVLNTTEEKELHPKVREYLFKIIELAKERDIQLVLIAAPHVLSSYEQEYFNSVARIAKDNSVPFINYNMLYDELGLDFDTDFKDSLHLNYRGAEKLSRHIAAFLAGEYGLPDRRNDPAWVDWNVWAERCENVMAEAIP
jgi:hypothetical protein